MNDCYVYIYCDPRVRWNGECLGVRLEFLPIYVGYGHRNRMLWHLKFRRCDRNLLKVHKFKAIIANGQQPIVMKVVDGLGKDMAQECERKWIAEIGTISEIPGVKRGPLTNLTAGGDGGATWIGRKMTAEHKEKIRKANTGVPFTEDRKKHLSEAQRKRVIVISDEKRKKMIAGIHNMTEVERRQRNEKLSGTIWINKDGKHRRIKQNKLDAFLTDGWVRGCLHGGNHKSFPLRVGNVDGDQCKNCGVRSE